MPSISSVSNQLQTNKANPTDIESLSCFSSIKSCTPDLPRLPSCAKEGLMVACGVVATLSAGAIGGAALGVVGTLSTLLGDQMRGSNSFEDMSRAFGHTAAGGAVIGAVLSIPVLVGLDKLAQALDPFTM